MATTEQKINKVRAEIAKRAEEAGRLHAKASRLFAEGDVDGSVEVESRTAAVERAVGLLQGELRSLTAALQEERLQAAMAEIDGRVEKVRGRLAEDARHAKAAWRAFFESWNRLVCTRVGQRSAPQLLGDFQLRFEGAAKVFGKAVEIALEIEAQLAEDGVRTAREEARRSIQSEAAELQEVTA